MPTLNHVYWKIRDYEDINLNRVPITASRAAELFGDKISANNEIFFCFLLNFLIIISPQNYIK